MIRASGQWPRVRELDKGGDVGPGLVGLHLESVLTDKAFVTSRNWLALGGAVPPGH